MSYFCWFAFALIYIIAMIMFFVAQAKANNIFELKGLDETKGSMTHLIDQVGIGADTALTTLTNKKISFFSALLSRDETVDSLRTKYNELKN